uniref:ABC transmembrane type-1 domain-containing protein n=1 Tax=Heterorhabditis bacteriophora TaxID=37862 RepID=A0A1I7XPB9_HETBA
MVTSGILHISALLFAVCGAPEFYQDIRQGNDVKYDFIDPTFLESPLCIAYLIWYPVVLIYTFLMCFADPRGDKYKIICLKKVPGKRTSELVTYFVKDRKRCETLVKKLNLFFKTNSLGGFSNSKEVPLPSVVACLFYMFRWEFLTASVLKLGSDTLQFANPFLLHQLIGFISDRTAPLWIGISYAILMFSASEVRSFLVNAYFYIMFRMGIKFQTILTAAVYKKTLLLSNSARRDKTVGEIVNLMAIDVERFQLITPQIQQFWSCPYQITLALIYLFITLSYSAAPGIIIMIIFVPMNIIGSMIVKNWQVQQMKLKDERTKMVNEVLNGMKVVKLYTWETPMEEHIDSIRQRELALIKKSAVVRNVIDAFNTASPFLVAFVSLTLFNQLRSPMTMIALLINQTVQAVVSNRRLKEFFVAEELDPLVVSRSEDPNNSRESIELRNFSATWELDSQQITLRDIEMTASRGALIAVVGTVGAGKSSLLSALLGELGKIRGKIGVRGKLAYVPQQPWIQNMTVRGNILFGKPYNKKLYNQVLNACALKSDLRILPNGDMTEIGEKGINLSGGQKARISLARAVYQDYDVYLLDDPLSAVDAHVGKHIYEKVIGPSGLLRHKTRILVTHGLSFVKSADEIFVLKDGKIAESGAYSNLIRKNGIFTEFIEEYKSKGEGDDEESLSRIENGGYIEDDYSDKSNDLSDVDCMTCVLIYTHATTFNVTFREFSLVGEQTSSLSKETQSPSLVLKEDGKLIKKETVESGKVKMSVYKLYVKAASYWLSFFFFIFLSAFMVFQIFRSFWLSAWSDEYDDSMRYHMRVEWRLGVYGALGTIECTSFLVSLMVLVHAGLSASRNLHSPLIHSLLRSPMSFFDTTPLGRILNRCAKDIETVDMLLPMNFRYLVLCVLQVVSTLIVIIISTPIFAVVILPLSIIYFIFLQNDLPTSLSSKWSFLSHSIEQINHLTTVAFGSNRFILLKEFIKHHTLRVPPDAQKDFFGNTVSNIQFLRFYVPTSRQLKRLESVHRSPIYSHFSETIQGAASIRAFNKDISVLCLLIYRNHQVGEFRKTSGNTVDAFIRCKYANIVSNRWLAVRLEFIGNCIVSVLLEIFSIKPSYYIYLLRYSLLLSLLFFPRNLDGLLVLELLEYLFHMHLTYALYICKFLGKFTLIYSVGQRQLICLARALLRSSRVLILDEATAAVDITTDALIQATIREQFKKCTVFTIAHRLNTIMDYDRIMVLDKGSVVEFDSPSILMEDKTSLFSKMVADYVTESKSV